MGKAKSPSTAPAQAQEARNALVQDIHEQAAEIAEEVAALLADLPAEQVFGDTEFLIRDKVLKLVARSLAAKLDQKKTAITGPASTASSAAKSLDSTATANETP
jgi:hypothetical protein